MGLIGRLFSLVGFVALVLVGLGAYLYFTDYEVDATITEKGNDGGNNYILLSPNLMSSYSVRQDIDAQAAQFICTGYEVSYRINTGFSRVFDRQGRLVWDSDNGLNDAIRTALTAC